MKLKIETQKHLPQLEAASNHVVVETHGSRPVNKFYQDLKLYIYLLLFVLCTFLLGMVVYSWLQMDDIAPIASTSEASADSSTFFTVPQNNTTKSPTPPAFSADTTTATQRTTHSTTTNDDKTSGFTLPHSSTQSGSSSPGVSDPAEAVTFPTSTSNETEMTTEYSSTFIYITNTSSTSPTSTTNKVVSTEKGTTSNTGNTTQLTDTVVTTAQTTVHPVTTTSPTIPTPMPTEILIGLVRNSTKYEVYPEPSNGKECTKMPEYLKGYNYTMVLCYKNNTSSCEFSASVFSSLRYNGDSHQGPAFLILNHKFPSELEVYKDSAGDWPPVWEKSGWTNPYTNFTCKLPTMF